MSFDTEDQLRVSGDFRVIGNSEDAASLTNLDFGLPSRHIGHDESSSIFVSCGRRTVFGV
jgi:hypothetical protein